MSFETTRKTQRFYKSLVPSAEGLQVTNCATVATVVLQKTDDQPEGEGQFVTAVTLLHTLIV